MPEIPATGRRRSDQAEVPPREISISAAIALAQASGRPRGGDRDRLTAGCRFAGTLRPGDAYWFSGHLFEPSHDPSPDNPDLRHQHMHRVIVVWGPRLDTTSDVFGRNLIRFWIWDPATGNEGSATFGLRGVVRMDLDSPYWVPAPGTLDRAAEVVLAHHPKCECATCRPDLAACHHPDCQCTGCEPGTWAPPAAAASVEFPGISLGLLAYDIADLLDRAEYPIDVADSDIEPALPGFLRAILANATADGGDTEAGHQAAASVEFPGISLGLLAYDIADLLDRAEYPIDVADSDIEPALPGFLRAILANATADGGDTEAGHQAAASVEFPGISLGLLAYDIADLLDRAEYPIDVADSDIEPALPGFLRAILIAG